MWIRGLLCVLFLSDFLGTYAVDWDEVTALDEYVAREDGVYHWEEIEHHSSPGVESYTLNLTSCRWLDETVVDRHIWWHYLVVNIPHNLRFNDSANLLIESGSNTNSPPGPEEMLVEFTNVTGAISAYLGQIPNQPIIFADDPDQKGRSEDGMIAYTWRMFLDDPSNPEVLARFPMVKATVKAMDAVTEFTKMKLGEDKVDIKRFMTAGGSKRGWVAWLIPAIDRRVFASVPVVLSCLNFQENLHHHFQSLGGWSFAFFDYWKQNITMDLDTPEMDLLASHVDPFAYRERLTMPILYMGGTGDEFFLPDDTHYWFKQLPQQDNKYLFWVVNAEHTLEPYHGRITYSLIGFFMSLQLEYELPQVSWELSEDDENGHIDLHVSRTPLAITGYQANTLTHIGANRRDFRLVTGTPPYVNPVIWLPEQVELISEGHYNFTGGMPLRRWTGLLIEMEFDAPEGHTITITTEVNIAPDVFPFPDCVGEECKGTLV